MTNFINPLSVDFTGSHRKKALIHWLYFLSPPNIRLFLSELDFLLIFQKLRTLSSSFRKGCASLTPRSIYLFSGEKVYFILSLRQLSPSACIRHKPRPCSHWSVNRHLLLAIFPIEGGKCDLTTVKTTLFILEELVNFLLGKKRLNFVIYLRVLLYKR